MTNSKKIALLELVLLFALFIFILPPFNHQPDVGCWRRWAVYIFNNGLGNVYQSDTNYPPIFLYCLSIYGFLLDNIDSIRKNINWIKIVPMIFDFIPLIFLITYKHFSFYKRKYQSFLLLNLAYIYNSFIWGQVDSIHSTLSLLSIIIAFDYPIVACILYILALNTKLQAIIFFPALLIVLVPNIKSIKTIVQLLLATAITQIIIIIPFILTGNLSNLVSVVLNSVGYWPKLSMNAFNFWHLAVSENPIKIKDNSTWILFSYKHVGMLLFFIFSAIILIPSFIKMITHVITKNKPNDKFKELMLLTSALITINFFFFNTQMHERYSHPALIFFFFYGIMSKRFELYILCSLAYFLNMEKVLGYLKIAHHTFIFEPKFIACLFLATLFLGIFYVYKNYEFKNDILLLKNKIKLNS